MILEQSPTQREVINDFPCEGPQDEAGAGAAEQVGELEGRPVWREPVVLIIMEFGEFQVGSYVSWDRKPPGSMELY